MTPVLRRSSAWRPLLQVSATSWLGEQGDDGGLWTGDAVRARAELDLERPVSCLPLLERRLHDVLDEVGRVRATCSAPTLDALDRLVPAAVIETALRSCSGYWSRGACGWLEVLPPSAQTADRARRLETDVAAGQATRHAAGRVRRRWAPGG